jgi:hypothetical protein
LKLETGSLEADVVSMPATAGSGLTKWMQLSQPLNAGSDTLCLPLLRWIGSSGKGASINTESRIMIHPPCISVASTPFAKKRKMDFVKKK